MTDPSCARSWQAEAIADDRLSERDRQSFEDHARACAQCSRELAAIRFLAELGKRLPEPRADELQQRRVRNAVLRRAHAASISSSAARIGWLRPAFGLLLLTGLACLLLFLLTRRGSESPMAPSAPSYEIVASPGGEVRAVATGPATRIAIRNGTFAVHVQKLGGSQRFVLELPDGELEVVGTTFEVTLDGMSTRRVVVSEGGVALRITNNPERLLREGESWAPEKQASHREEAPAVQDAGTPARAAADAGAVLRPADAGVSEAGHQVDEFVSAMRAMSAGDWAQAESLFRAFEENHPQEARVEDAAFLRALCYARRGDTAAARAAAQEYLRRFPNGLRRPEAERLAK